MSERPFSRHYYVDLARDYPGMYRDNNLHATYSRLLDIADAMWPAIPEIPRSEKALYVHQLVGLGLVIRDGDYGFRIKGLDAERIARSNAASNAARNRWGTADASPRALPVAMPTGMPSQTSPVQPVQPRAQSAPKNGHLIDPQTQTPEEYKAGIEAAAQRLGLPVKP